MNEFYGHPDQRWGCTSYAQHGDDFMLLNLFDLIGVEKPNYLDLGAHHPTIISNTRKLYERGSRGVNVDANPNLIEQFNLDRPDDVNVHCGVGCVRGDMPFYMYSDTSGRNTFSMDEVAKLEGMLSMKSIIRVPVKTINDIVAQYCNGKFPHLLSCDIEGLDFEVLQSANWHPDPPLVVCVETRRNESLKMIAMMQQKGFFPYCRMWENLFFVQFGLRELVY